MQLSANKTAKFLVQDEYHHVSIDDDFLVVKSSTVEERIPFNVWNGKVTLKVGLLWGGLQFFAHEENNTQRSWLVQGLPQQQCRDFARNAIATYQQWHKHQCEQLSQFLPEWERSTADFLRLPHYLSHSKVAAWRETVDQNLTQMGMSLEDTQQRMPSRMKAISPWIMSPEHTLELRNQTWIENERRNWEVLFSQVESSPLNMSQQTAVLLNDDNNLVLAGAGSGKTAVLTARVAYLLQSHLAQADELLMVAFGKAASKEMEQRLNDKIGLAAENVQVNTFHQLGLQILNSVEPQPVVISPLALDEKQRQAWCIDWLKKHWMTPNNFKRWQKHLSQWPIAYLAGDDELGSHVENPKLIAWLEQQTSQLSALSLTKKELQGELVSHRDYTRLNSELSLVWPCYQAWVKNLKENGQIDFNIMITRATDYVRKGKFKPKWKCIMIDEYQDISPQRLALIESLCERAESEERCTLFAVGDDWQSIYQFAGSDVDLTTGFKIRFPHSKVHYLDTTYRFNSQLGEVANRFIQQNPNQLEKTLNSYKQQKQKSVYITSSGNIEKVLDQLNRQSKQPKTLLLLGRNHYHKPELLADWQRSYDSLSIEFMTCHSSKGKEADFVIIVGVDEGQFPARVKALHIDGALSTSNDDFAFAEERRLFYVALTRAKEKVWVTHSGAGSTFVKELLEEEYPVIKQK